MWNSSFINEEFGKTFDFFCYKRNIQQYLSEDAKQLKILKFQVIFIVFR